MIYVSVNRGKAMTAHCTEGYVINNCYEGWRERQGKLVHINTIHILPFQSSAGKKILCPEA